MKASKISIALVVSAGLSACASTSVIPISANQIVISISAAPICAGSGANRVAAKMAAVETLRRGYSRFIVLGVNNQNNVSVVSTGPTYSRTTSNYSVGYNDIRGTSTTTYGGQGMYALGSHDSSLNVLMLNPGDDGYEKGIDAKVELGPDWETIVLEGVNTCL